MALEFQFICGNSKTSSQVQFLLPLPRMWLLLLNDLPALFRLCHQMQVQNMSITLASPCTCSWKNLCHTHALLICWLESNSSRSPDLCSMVLLTVMFFKVSCRKCNWQFLSPIIFSKILIKSWGRKKYLIPNIFIVYKLH